LVLGFGFPEIAGGRDLGYDLSRPKTGGIDVDDRILSDALLFLARVEDWGEKAKEAIPRIRVGKLQLLRLMMSRSNKDVVCCAAYVGSWHERAKCRHSPPMSGY
jgi:hypothetical protein